MAITVDITDFSDLADDVKAFRNSLRVFVSRRMFESDGGKESLEARLKGILESLMKRSWENPRRLDISSRNQLNISRGFASVTIILEHPWENVIYKGANVPERVADEGAIAFDLLDKKDPINAEGFLAQGKFIPVRDGEPVKRVSGYEGKDIKSTFENIAKKELENTVELIANDLEDQFQRMTR